jgi:hypothetical protein
MVPGVASVLLSQDHQGPILGNGRKYSPALLAKKRPDHCDRSRPVTGNGSGFRAAGVGDACRGPRSGFSLNRESGSSRRAESPFQRKQSMSTISYPYLPAAAHQPDGEHLQFGDHYIHYGEPMRSAASEQGSIYTPMMTEPEQTRTGTDLEVYLQTRVLRCGCGFQMEIPDKNRSRDRQGQSAARPAQSRKRPSVRRYWRPNTQTDRKERAGTLMRPAGDRRDPETRADITPHQPDRGDCHDNRTRDHDRRR